MHREGGGTTVCYIDPLEEGLYYEKQKKTQMYSCMMYDKDFGDAAISPAFWNKLIRTDLIREILVQLDDSIVYGEDIAVVYACCISAKKVVVTHKVYYHYLLRQNSAAHSANINYLSIINGIYIFLKKICEQSEYKLILREQLELHMVYQMLKGINFNMGFAPQIHIPYYDFCKNVIERGAKVLLYGAGKVGQDYYRQIKSDSLYQLVGWVDKNYRGYQEQGMNVMPTSHISCLEFDYVLLALKYEEQANKVRDSLISEYEIESEKILWIEPISIVTKYCL